MDDRQFNQYNRPPEATSHTVIDIFTSYALALTYLYWLNTNTSDRDTSIETDGKIDSNLPSPLQDAKYHQC